MWEVTLTCHLPLWGLTHRCYTGDEVRHSRRLQINFDPLIFSVHRNIKHTSAFAFRLHQKGGRCGRETNPCPWGSAARRHSHWATAVDGCFDVMDSQKRFYALLQQSGKYFNWPQGKSSWQRTWEFTKERLVPHKRMKPLRVVNLYLVATMPHWCLAHFQLFILRTAASCLAW